MKLTRYWFKFKFDEFVEIPAGVSLGCGVTAYEASDALKIVKEKIFKGNDLPEIIAQQTDVDVSTLDVGHVIPNMYPPNRKGIWFPMGYNDDY